MKSVVVEASTVAKAIEIAWHKAEKPEEFFIRILQEHQSGFLGFGSLKAKIVFFFKNTQKSDSLFPVVLKQKEYASFFGNQQLKVPVELNVVDTELNKNVGSHGQKKKSQQQKQKNQQVQSGKLIEQHNAVDKQIQQDKNRQEKTVIQVDNDKHHDKNRAASLIKIQHKPVKKNDDKNLFKLEHNQNNDHKKTVHVEHHKKQAKPVEPKLQVTLQVAEKIENHKETESFEKKDDVVKDIARALKKVQSQKIVAPVSRQVSAKMQEKKVQDIVVVDEQKSKERVQQVVEQHATAPKVVTKFKRRPLSTDNQGVSGIKPRSVQVVVEDVEKKNDHVVEALDKKDSN